MMAAMLAAGRPAKSFRTFFPVNKSPCHLMATPLSPTNTRNILKAALGACYARFVSSDAFSDGRSGCSRYARGLCGSVSGVDDGQHDRHRCSVENVYLGLLEDPVVMRTVRDFYELGKDGEVGHQSPHQILTSTKFLPRSWPFLSSDATRQPFEQSQVRSFRTDTRHHQQGRYAADRNVNHHYYDVLGVTPRATQTQIKSAYYKKSMQFHPDRNKTAFAADRFTEINEAYEVLGQVDLRRRYDQGILNKSDLLKERKPKAQPPQQKGSHQTYSDTRVQNRGNLGYNVDEWLRGHYGDALEQEKKRKRVRERYKEFKKLQQRNRNDSYIAFALLAIAAAVVILLK